MIGRARAGARHGLVRDTVALGGVQLASYAIPLLTLPVLARALEPTAFGQVVLAQALLFLLAFVLDFGFGQSAARDLARAGADPAARREIVAGVHGAKLLLLAGATVLVAAALLALPALREAPELVALTWLAGTLQGLWPMWFFLGTEEVRAAAVVDVAARLVAAVLIVLLVRDPGDGWVVLALWAGASLVSTGVLTVRMARRVAFARPTRDGTRAALRGGAALFLARAAVQLYTTTNVLLLGLLVSAAQVAQFGAAERVVRAGTRLVGPLTAAAFPRASRLVAAGDLGRARRLARASVLVLGAGCAVAAAVVALAADLVVAVLLGPGYEEAGPVLRVLALVLPLNALSGVLVGQWLLPLGRDGAVSRLLLGAGVANLALALALVPPFGPLGMAWGLVATEALVLVGATMLTRGSPGGLATVEGSAG